MSRKNLNLRRLLKEISILLKILLIIIPLLLSRVVYFSRNRRCNFGEVKKEEPLSGPILFIS